MCAKCQFVLPGMGDSVVFAVRVRGKCGVVGMLFASAAAVVGVSMFLVREA